MAAYTINLTGSSPVDSAASRSSPRDNSAPRESLRSRRGRFTRRTCGKVERFNQTLKKWLRRQPLAATLAQLQAQLDWFRHYYNHERPHRAIGRVQPAVRFFASARLTPSQTPIPEPEQHLALTVTRSGRVETRQWMIAIGVRYAGLPAEVYLSADHANVFIDGELVRHVTLDPTRRYQPSGTRRGGPRQPRPE